MPRYTNYTAEGIAFVFKYDAVAPDLLHIYARHLTSPDDAISTFFTAEAKWNAEHKRYENYSTTHAVYWYWIKQDSVVMIVTCFRLP